MARTDSSKGKARKVGMSDKTKKMVLAASGCLVLVIGGWWAYRTFTTVPPPPLEKATANEVVSFLGNSQGFARMSADARREYIVQTYQKFSQGEARQQLATAFNQMSTREKQVFVDTSFDMMKKQILQSAGEYNSMPKHKQNAFVDNMIRTFDVQRAQVAGSGGADNLGEAFKSMMPTTTDGLAKAVVSRTNSRQRAKAQPLVDHMAARVQELRQSGKMQ